MTAEVSSAKRSDSIRCTTNGVAIRILTKDQSSQDVVSLLAQARQLADLHPSPTERTPRKEWAKCEQDKAIEIAATAAALWDEGHRQKIQIEYQDNPDATGKDTRAAAAEGECEWSLEQLQGEST